MWLTIIRTYDEAGKVGEVASQAVCSGFEVALVAGQIHKSHHLGRLLNVVCRGRRSEHGIIQDLPLAIQLHNQSGWGAGATQHLTELTVLQAKLWIQIVWKQNNRDLM